ncbi:hypothetical protein DENSPDRAFT_839528 [Dentipellis sp. KUC8613]|nr:hypothetical protein DENSPDRAFT_839528 [Dentipellis sp. KUC8613]
MKLSLSRLASPAASPTHSASPSIDMAHPLLTLNLTGGEHNNRPGSKHAFTQEYVFTVPEPGGNSSPLSRRSRHMVKVRVRTIDRGQIAPGKFHLAMSGVCEDFLQFSVAVFSTNGRIRKTIGDRDPESESDNRGSGAWSKEINHGKLAYIEQLEVNERYRGRGIGRWAVYSILSNPIFAECQYVFTWPNVLGSGTPFDPADENYMTKKAGIISFWRKLGFRRVGGTYFFGYARDPQHPSRSLPIEDDGLETQKTDACLEAVQGSEYRW